ncbi:MAG: hypothetical protein WB462_08200, partial [Solirubrobacterales bacterium]
AAAAIGTKAAAGLATAAIIAGGAAEIQNVSDHHPASKPQSKTRQIHKTPPATAAKADATEAATPPATPATTPPVAATTPPPITVTVPPQTTDPTASTGSQTGGTTASATGKHKRHKHAVANSDSQPTAPAQTGPVTTGVEPSTCDANGDGIDDPGAPSGCVPSGGTVSTGVQPGEVTATPYSAPKKRKAAPKSSSKSSPKKKVRRR